MITRLTVHQHLIRSLTKRIKVARVHVKGHWFLGSYLKPYDHWEIQMDGRRLPGTDYYSGSRADMRHWRLEVIEKQASLLMPTIRSLRLSGFKVGQPSSNPSKS